MSVAGTFSLGKRMTVHLRSRWRASFFAVWSKANCWASIARFAAPPPKSHWLCQKSVALPPGASTTASSMTGMGPAASAIMWATPAPHRSINPFAPKFQSFGDANRGRRELTFICDLLNLQRARLIDPIHAALAGPWSPAVFLNQLHSSIFKSPANGRRVGKCHRRLPVDRFRTVDCREADPKFAHKVRSGPTQEGPSCSHLSSQNILHGRAHFPYRPLTSLLSYDKIFII